jgi:hypothetical protein
MNIKEASDFYSELYTVLKPNSLSIQEASEIWDKWETEDLKRPNIEKIADDDDFQINFFNEIVGFIFGKNHEKIIYLPFLLKDYNYHAFTASDGYIVLCDEKFDQLLFFIITICTFLADNNYNRNEKHKIENYLRNGIKRYYIHHEDIELLNDNYFDEIIKSSYEISEKAIYLLNAIFAFMFCHELGHHVLGHTHSKEKQIIKMKNEEYSYEVDMVSLLDEYAADDYAFDIFKKLLNVDKDRYFTFFKYRFEYAPLLFFDICSSLDKLSAIINGQKIHYTKHPNPHKRRNKLRDTKIIERDSFYFYFRSIVYNIYKGI